MNTRKPPKHDVKPNPIITFMNTHSSWGGGEKWHFEAACFFHDLNYKVHFLCNKGSELDRRLQAKGVQCIHFSVSNLSFLNPYKLFLLHQHLGASKRLILNSPADNKLAGVYSLFNPALKIIFRRGMPHPISPSLLNRWIFGSRVHRVIANSETVKDSLNHLDKTLIPADKIEVIYNGFDFEDFDKQAYQAVSLAHPATPTLVSCGRLVKQKNHQLLLQAANILKQKNMDFKLLIVGDGPLKNDLQQFIVDHQLSDVCELYGFSDNIKGVLKATTLFLLPSFYEGSSNALIEACGSGLGAIVSDIPSNREIITHGENGYLLPNDDPKQWADRIVELITNKEKLKTFGLNSQHKIQNTFAKHKNRKKLKDIIDECCL